MWWFATYWPFNPDALRFRSGFGAKDDGGARSEATKTATGSRSEATKRCEYCAFLGRRLAPLHSEYRAFSPLRFALFHYFIPLRLPSPIAITATYVLNTPLRFHRHFAINFKTLYTYILSTHLALSGLGLLTPPLGTGLKLLDLRRP